VTARVDHLVVAARSLDEGQAWSEAVFGITPGPGGKHRLMGTHNRLFAVGSPAYPRAYLEIIAIDPAAAVSRPRWFDLDDAGLQAAVAREPRLVHFVARCDHAETALAALRAGGDEPGDLVAAERETPSGTLRWQLTIRSDGRRLCHGALPTLIEWTGVHPADSMPASGVRLTSLTAFEPDVARLERAWQAIGLRGVIANAGAPDLVATFATARGDVVLHSNGT
jgi:hypothetical protein